MKSNRKRMVRGGRALLASLGVLAGLLALAPPARAQLTRVCGFLSGAGDEIYGAYLGELNAEWGFDLGDEALCERITRNFVRACEHEMEDLTDCWVTQYRTLGKQNRIGCKAGLNGEVDQCTSFYDDHRDADIESIQEVGEEEFAMCGDFFAGLFFDVCLNGV
jgi:hypothetical protein